MVWTRLGLDPHQFYIALVFVGAFVAIALGASPVVSFFSAAALVAFSMLWLAMGIRRGHAALRKHNITAKPPSVIVYVPGLGAGWMDAKMHNWLFGGGEAAAPRVISVPPPRSWYMNLGDDDYVDDVLNALEAIPKRERDRVALVGSSRGAGVVLATLAARQAETMGLMAAVMLNGPFTTVRGVMEHRYGRVGRWVSPVVEVFCSPARLDTLAVPTQLPPLFFVTAAGDTNLPPEAVKATAKKWGGKVLELGADTGHSLLLASVEDKKRVQDFIVGGLATAAAAAASALR
jgi:hypothetical protein